MDHAAIGFIGAGNMATAIISGMLRTKQYDPSKIYIFDLDQNKKRKIAQMGVTVCDHSLEVVKQCAYVVLAVKPQNYKEVLGEIKPAVRKDLVVISIAAGISTNYIKENLQCNCPVVRAMPNTPLLLGEGATALCASNNVSKEQFRTVCDLFSASGIVEILTEDKMNAVIAVNGSSPAYVYLFAKAIVDFASRYGIDQDQAMQLCCQTLKGSAQMLSDSGQTPEELIRMVSSPGGTTLEALKVLEQKGFYHAIQDAMAQCTKRAQELAK